MNTVQTDSSRSRLRFSLRWLFAVATLAGCLLGWTVAQWQWIQERDEARRWLLPLEERQLAAVEGRTPPPRRGEMEPRGKRAPWRLAMFGEEGVGHVILFTPHVTPEWYQRFRRLFPEAAFTVRRAPADDQAKTGGEAVIRDGPDSG